jgi:cell division protein FtsX
MTDVAVRAKNWLDSESVTRLFKVIAIMSLMASLFVGVKQYQLTSCLATYNDAANANQQLRAQAAGEERDALDAMISAIAEVQTVPAASRQAAVAAAFQDYLQSRAYIDGKREVMPIPAPPSQTCG